MYSCNVFQKEQFAVARVCTMTWYHLPFPRLCFPTYSPHEKPNSIAYPIFKLPMQLNLLPYCQSMQWNPNSLMINATMKLPALLKDCCYVNWLADLVRRFHYALIPIIPLIQSPSPSLQNNHSNPSLPLVISIKWPFLHVKKQSMLMKGMQNQNETSCLLVVHKWCCTILLCPWHPPLHHEDFHCPFPWLQSFPK